MSLYKIAYDWSIVITGTTEYKVEAVDSPDAINNIDEHDIDIEKDALLRSKATIRNKRVTLLRDGD